MSSQPPPRKRTRRQVIPLSSLSTIRARRAAAPLRPTATTSASREFPAAAPSPPSFPTQPRPPVLIDPHSEGSSMAGNYGRRWTGKNRRAVSIDMLPDDVLLEIFDFFMDETRVQAWQSLVRVCGRWRSVVFGSPNRLNLRLVCTAKTSVRDMLDIWPALPLLLRSHQEGGLDEIIAALERRDRVREIDLDISSSHLENLSIAMQKPFPELKYLRLMSDGEVALPDSLGGSAACLRILTLDCIPFPGLPKLLLSATHLAALFLRDIPHSGYFSPEAMGTALSALASLERLTLEFQSPLSRPDRAIRRPPTCCVLSVLTTFRFKGDSEYLDNLVVHIDAPQLDKLYITFFNDIVLDTPQFFQFIGRTALNAIKEARVTFGGGGARVNFISTNYELNLKISCRDLDWQVSSLEQVFTSCLPPLSTLEDIYIYEDQYWQSHPQDNVENVRWLELLHPFRAVKNLYLSEEFALQIVPALQEIVGGRATEVLPTLQNIFLQEGLRVGPLGSTREGIGKFVATRQTTSHPIVVSSWDRDADRILHNDGL